jgi:dihydrofolate reductase
MLTLIAARARDGAIGRNGGIPWHAPEDLAFFGRETAGGALVMGRRTWESLPVRPLPRRPNLVVTSHDCGADHRFSTPDAAVAAAAGMGHARVYGIGGAGIYAALLPVADRLLLTEVDVAVPDADAFFPAFDPANWVCTLRRTLRAADPECILCEWLRRR